MKLFLKLKSLQFEARILRPRILGPRLIGRGKRGFVFHIYEQFPQFFAPSSIYLFLFALILSEKPVDTVFTIVKANTFQDTVKARTVFPVEIALVSFSLAQGITNVYSSLIDIERVNPGNAFNAKLLSETTGLPLPGSCHFRVHHRDYHSVAGEIIKIVEKYDLPGSRTRTILFGMNNDLEEASDAIKWLADHCDGDQILQDGLMKIEFLDLSRLFNRVARFVHLKQKSYNPPTVQFNLVAVAEKQLNRSVRFNFRSEITCLYHSRIASEFMNMCAQNYCIQRVFTILDEFLEPLSIRRENGHYLSNFHLNLPSHKHVPSQNVASSSVTFQKEET
ncbi:unnamed protein product [Allacma fusca]|uniref:Maelstrom domain-containing protein n=1 Tax=Allacma fusca TaxID=39272 RepID=A0A8J2PXJ7_9HEXA|nr:unnamed protein product [Allacma fusca]